jgi:hypothetical protein
MHLGDKSAPKGVKTSLLDEHGLKGWFAARSAALCQPRRMTRQLSPRKTIAAALLGAAMALIAAAPARAMEPMGPGVARGAQTSGPDVYTAAPRRPGLLPPRAHRSQPISERRRRRAPDAFRGLMTPGFGAGGDCRAPRQVRRRLQRQGWWDFQGLRRSGEDFVVRARRPNGTVYRLQIQRCSGQVLEATPLNNGDGPNLWAR